MNKPGRNDPCPCGSGNKYKRCCLEKDTAAQRTYLQLVGSGAPAAPQPMSRVVGYVVDPQPETVQEEEPKKLTLAGLKKMVNRELEWPQPAHQETALQLIEGMKDDTERELIGYAITLWHSYCTSANPVVRKPGAFCAAVEYLVSEQFGFGLTQGGLAAKYGVSAGTVSARFQDLINYDDEDDLGAALADGDAEAHYASGSASRAEAAALLFRAFQETSPEQRAELAREAIRLHPDCPEAYLMLAENQTDQTEVRSLLKQGVEAGERELGREFFEQYTGHFWGVPETRPYMQIKMHYAQTCWMGGEAEEAERQLEQMLELNPNDNHGARYLLVAVYLYRRRLDRAAELLQRYNEEGSAAWSYDKLVLEYLKRGTSSSLKMMYRVAVAANSHIPDYLCDRKPLPLELPDAVVFGDEDEAVEYVLHRLPLWSGLQDLIEWMKKQ